MFSKIAQNIICPLQFKNKRIIGFFNFFCTDLFWSVICYSGSFDHNILICKTLRYRLKHFSCSGNLHRIHKQWPRQTCLTGHQCYMGSAETADSRHCISHLSRGMIGQISHRIHRFLCRSGCHQNIFTCQILFIGNLFHDIFQKHFRFRHLSCSHILAGQKTHCRLNHFKSIPFQCFQIILYNRIFKHMSIHSR